MLMHQIQWFMEMYSFSIMQIITLKKNTHTKVHKLIKQMQTCLLKAKYNLIKKKLQKCLFLVITNGFNFTDIMWQSYFSLVTGFMNRIYHPNIDEV